jgi:hypothetical protein
MCAIRHAPESIVLDRVRRPAGNLRNNDPQLLEQF